MEKLGKKPKKANRTTFKIEDFGQFGGAREKRTFAKRAKRFSGKERSRGCGTPGRGGMSIFRVRGFTFFGEGTPPPQKKKSRAGSRNAGCLPKPRRAAGTAAVKICHKIRGGEVFHCRGCPSGGQGLSPPIAQKKGCLPPHTHPLAGGSRWVPAGVGRARGGDAERRRNYREGNEGALPKMPPRGESCFSSCLVDLLNTARKEH